MEAGKGTAQKMRHYADVMKISLERAPIPFKVFPLGESLIDCCGEFCVRKNILLDSNHV